MPWNGFVPTTLIIAMWNGARIGRRNGAKTAFDIGTSREEDFEDGQALVVNKDSFEMWMQLVRRHRSSEDSGFELGGRLLDLVEGARNADDDDACDEWNVMRSLAADALGNSFLRVASTLCRDVLAAVLYSHDAIEIDDATDMSAKKLQTSLSHWPPEDLPVEILRLHSEMMLACEDVGKDVPLEHAGALSSAAASDDVGLRGKIVGASEAVLKKFGFGAGDESAGPGDAREDARPVEPGARPRQYPRVDAPEVEDAAAMAIRENTPGYIAMAFPKLFPHGTGDFHDDQGGRTASNSPYRLLTFAQWGGFVMTWHDGRFARHSRFRYWLVDTSLRAMAPSLQHTFLKTHAAAKDYTLQDLEDPGKRKDLVGQMSTSTSRMPGSVGERRSMRQKLEGMVNQIEAETADQKENGGQGRIPGGFCTLTCPVYKWEQLFDLALKSYPSGAPDDPNSSEFCTQWKTMPCGADRNTAMRQAFYRLSVDNPACVQWYCSLKLEMALHLVADVVTRQLQSADVPGLELTKERVRKNLQEKLGVPVSVGDMDLPDLRHFGQVDDYWLSYEWSDGGIIHAHIALWIVGSPRIDKINIPKQLPNGAIEVDVESEDVRVLAREEAANQMAEFWDRLITEFNVSKAFQGHQDAAAQAKQATDKGEFPTPLSLTAKAIDVLYSLCDSIGRRKDMGVKAERATTSPECISVRALTHCLLQSGAVTEDESRRCWEEYDDIMLNCSRSSTSTGKKDGMPLAAVDDPSSDGLALPAEDNRSEHRSARARTAFVASLAEWVNMHDYHEPFPNGPPGAHQSCAAEDKGRIYCNKLYPRKTVRPGQEEISEDPRRRDLFRLWLARNCKFLNNFVPIVMLAMLSNCDFQATMTKDAVIEYMTKYMTKSGQGSLVKVMEQSFSLCLEKAREKNQGSGSAMLRWFNVQSITEVKSPLETMHLIFGAPRWLSSRGFTDMWLRSDIRKIKTPADISNASSSTEKLAFNSEAEKYWQRHEWAFPGEEDLLEKHPLTGAPFWREILQSADEDIPAGHKLADRINEVESAWPGFLQRLSWWELKRYFIKRGGSLKYKPKADVVIVHPEGRFTTAMTSERWREACVFALMAYCNHGPCCADTTFADLASLEAMAPDDLEALMQDFVQLAGAERKAREMTTCPPHLERNYRLGHARRARAEERKLSHGQVAVALPQVKYVFADAEEESWKCKCTQDMDGEEVQASKSTWALAEAEDAEEAAQLDATHVAEEADLAPIRARMQACLRQWKVTAGELHNATLAAGLPVPVRLLG